MKAKKNKRADIERIHVHDKKLILQLLKINKINHYKLQPMI